jgi:hypothetical protein
MIDNENSATSVTPQSPVLNFLSSVKILKIENLKKMTICFVECNTDYVELVHNCRAYLGSVFASYNNLSVVAVFLSNIIQYCIQLCIISLIVFTGKLSTSYCANNMCRIVLFVFLL